MALQQIRMAAPSPKRQEERRKEKHDPWDEVMKGLTIANQGFGLAVNYQKFQSLREGREADAAARKDAREGVLTAADEAALLRSGKVDFSESPSENSRPIGVRRGEEVSTVHLSPRQPALKPPGTRVVKTVDENGRPVEKIVEDKPGLTLPSYERPRAPTGPTGFEISKEVNSAANTFARDTRDIRESLDAAREINVLAKEASGNPAITPVLLRKIGRAAGEIRMTDADAKAFGGSQSIADRFLRWAQQAEDGTMTAEDIQNATRLSQVMERNAAKSYLERADRYVGRFHRTFGTQVGTQDELFMKFTGAGRGALEQAANSDPGPLPPGSGGGPPKAPGGGAGDLAPGTVFKSNGKTYQVADDGVNAFEVSNSAQAVGN